eukprot:Opistho-2@47570
MASICTQRRYTNIVFDLGGVLIDWDPHAIASRMFAADPSTEVDASDVSAVARATRHPAWKAYNAGALDVDGVVHLLAADGVNPVLMRRFATDYSAYTPTLEGGLRALARVHSAGHYRTFILSNYPRGPYEALLSTHGDAWMGAFDGATVSYAVGETKPSAAIYERFLRDHSLSASDCLFIDDKHENIAAAKGAGIDGIVCSNPDALVGVLEAMRVL